MYSTVETCLASSANPSSLQRQPQQKKHRFRIFLAVILLMLGKMPSLGCADTCSMDRLVAQEETFC